MHQTTEKQLSKSKPRIKFLIRTKQKLNQKKKQMQNQNLIITQTLEPKNKTVILTQIMFHLHALRCKFKATCGTKIYRHSKY